MAQDVQNIYIQIEKYEALIVDLLGAIYLDISQLLYPRKSICALMKHAVKCGKRIYVHNNSTLSAKETLDLLRSEDILLKQEQVIFAVKECIGDKKEGCLWLTGESQTEDFKGDVWKLSSPMEMLSVSAWKDVFEEVKTDADNLVVALLAARVFNDPFSRMDADGRPIVDKIEDFAYLFVGPFVTGFMRWFLRQIRKEKYDKILFSMRDGYIIQKIYDDLRKTHGLRDMPDGIYFPISRTLCVASAVFTSEDIVAFAKVKYTLAPEAMLVRRFGLDKADIMPYEEGRYSSVIEYALAHEDKILARSREIRENYLLYIKKAGLKKGEKYALFDFVSSGTCQLLLKYICDLDVEGVYACRYFPFKGITNYTSEEDKYKLPIQAYVVNQSTTEKETYFFKNYNFLEIIFTSDEPSVASMGSQGPILDQEQRSEQDLEAIRKAQSAICKYVRELDSCLEPEDEISFELIDKILALKDSRYTREKCAALDDCELIEDFGQGRIKLKRQ